MIRFQPGRGPASLSATVVVLACVLCAGRARCEEPPAADAEAQSGAASPAEDDGASSRLREFTKKLQSMEQADGEADASTAQDGGTRRLPSMETAQLPGRLKAAGSESDAADGEGGAISPLLRSLHQPGALEGNVLPAGYSDLADHDTSVSIGDAVPGPELVQPGFEPGAYDGGGYPSAGWGWTLLPEGLIYKSYLAGRKEPRFESVWAHEEGFGSIWDVALGGRVGILRWGSYGECNPQGWQLDIEGAAFPRLDMNDGRRDLVSADFRFGIPLTQGVGPWKFKYAYYHLSSHLGDEFLLRTGAMRINYVRDALVYGVSYDAAPGLRLYGEAGYAFHYDGGAHPWEFQFGIDWTPACPTGFCGAPFAAANVHLRQDFDFGGGFTVEAGWCWRGNAGRLIRTGVLYYNGKSPQWEFYDEDEEQLGFGIWYDY